MAILILNMLSIFEEVSSLFTLSIIFQVYLHFISIFRKYQVFLYFLSFFNMKMVQVVEILLYKWQDCLWSYIVNTKTADDLATQGARSSAAMVLT